MSDNYIHKDYPKTVGRKEFWKQIKRTVNGREVSEKDIQTIVSAVKAGMCLNKKDNLLDLGCGNGALASRFFADINRYQGVDFSPYLLEIAAEHFFVEGKTTYQELDLSLDFEKIKNISAFNKVLMYGAFAYLKREVASDLLRFLGELKHVRKIYLGNMPDSEFAKTFYSKRDITQFDTDDDSSAIGVWWSTTQLCRIVSDAGFSPKVYKMPDHFYASKYRFDIVGSK
jgi:SAM-dependent methyltransferase